MSDLAEKNAELQKKNKELENAVRSLNHRYEISKLTIERFKLYISSKDRLLAAILAEKTQQEKYFKLLLENTREIMILLDQQLRFVYCSEIFLRQAGILSFGLIEEQDFTTVFRQFVDQDSADFLSDLLGTVVVENLFQAENRAMDIGMQGSKRHYTIFIIPMLQEEGNLEGVLMLFQDMTDIMEAMARTEQANKAKSTFLARMSHEIRTPLNAVLGLSEVELRNPHSDATRINLEKIYSSGSQLLEIVNDILDISKIETGNFEVFPGEYEFTNLLNDALQLNIVRIGSKPVDFKLKIDDTIPFKLYGDELRVRQILNNLLSNAIKYTDQGEVRLIVEWERREIIAWLTFSVEDTGRGIREEDMGKLFGEYIQFDTAANRRIEGTGLGLSITLGLVNMMGGTIEVQSEYGKGSVFQVRIPQGIIDSAPIGKEVVNNLRNFRFMQDRSRSRGNTIIRSYMPYGKVLVVDDLVTNLDVMTGLLMPYGLYVDVATSGQEAVDRIRSEEVRYDLVFMDHMMPEMDGIEAARIIRSDIDTEYARKVPMIVLTANAIMGNREMFLKSGFNDFIPKPIDIKRLDQVLNQWIRDKQSEEVLQDAEKQARIRGGSQNLEGPDAAGGWLLEQQIEGMDFQAALTLYGGKGGALLPILKSFVTHTPPLLEKMDDHLFSSIPNYTIEVHGLKGTCNAICAAPTAQLAKELELASKEGRTEFVQARHGELKQMALKLTGDLGKLLAAWDAAHPVEEKEVRPSPDRELLSQLCGATGQFNSNLTEELLEKIEQYRYETDDDLVRWLRDQAENFDYDAIHRRLEKLLEG
ncbi:MAG: response regulator [Spirochaetales bacterium]|nr:response regulator [Spirochaetales bacterium]